MILQILTLLFQFVRPDHIGQTHAIPPLIIAGIMAAHAIRTGIQDKKEADNALADLAKNKPEGYKITPEQQSSYDRAQQMALHGYSPQERSAFLANLAQQNNQQYSKAFQVGGNTLSGAIQAGINYGNSSALNQFAASDAEQQLNNVRHADSIGEGLSNQRNLNTGQQLGEYQQKMLQWGAASRDAKLRQENAINNFGAQMVQGGDSGGGFEKHMSNYMKYSQMFRKKSNMGGGGGIPMDLYQNAQYQQSPSPEMQLGESDFMKNYNLYK